MPYKHRLIKLKLLPLNYWLEYLNFHGHIDLTRSFNYYFSFVTSHTHQACSGLNLKINNSPTSTFRDFYFNRIANLWNNIFNDVRQAESIDSSINLSRFLSRDFSVFDGDNTRTFKIIYPKCCRVNTLVTVTKICICICFRYCFCFSACRYLIVSFHYLKFVGSIVNYL